MRSKFLSPRNRGIWSWALGLCVVVRVAEVLSAFDLCCK